MIEEYFPTIPKIELNRRGPPRPGWGAYGNEVEPEKVETTKTDKVEPSIEETIDPQETAEARKAVYAASDIDETGLTVDPKKDGIPVFLQTQNR